MKSIGVMTLSALFLGCAVPAAQPPTPNQSNRHDDRAESNQCTGAGTSASTPKRDPFESPSSGGPVVTFGPSSSDGAGSGAKVSDETGSRGRGSAEGEGKKSEGKPTKRTPQLSCLASPSRDRIKKLARKCVQTVQPGQSITKIASLNALSRERLRALNDIPEDCDRIDAGQTILVCEDPPLRIDPPPPPPPPPPVAKACMSHMGPANGSANRVVLLVKGDVPSLFAKYRSQTEAAHVKVDWASVAVVFFDAAGVEQRVLGEKPTFAEALAGISAVQKLRTKLDGLKSAGRLDPDGDAQRFGSDLVCGP